jgi:hypothetical protein
MNRRTCVVSLVGLLVYGSLGATPAGAAVKDLQSGLLRFGDLPAAPKGARTLELEEHMLWHHYDNTMTSGRRGSYNCYPPSSYRTGWQSGLAQSITNGASGFFAVCAVLFTNARAAHNAYLTTARGVREGLSEPGVQRLRLPSIAAERIGYTQSPGGTFQATFRQANAVVTVSASSTQPLYGPKDFVHLVKTVESRLH